MVVFPAGLISVAAPRAATGRAGRTECSAPRRVTAGRRATANRRTAFLLLLVSAVFPSVATAANVDATWNGGAGNWGTASNWSGNLVPNNAGGNTFSVFIDGANPTSSLVTLDVNSTITNLTIDSGDQLSQNNNQALVLLGGTATNNGIWSLNSVGNFTDLICASAATLSGSGSIVMSDNINNRILPNDNTVCTNGKGHTIRGAGQLLVNTGGMHNAGTIIANQSNNGLVIDPNALNFTNTGTLEAMSTGTLVLQSGTFINTMGLIEALDTSSVAINSATVMDGTMTTGALGRIHPNGSTFTNVTNTGVVEELNNQSATITGTLTNDGSWELTSMGNLTDLYCSGGAMLSGTGSIVMSDNGNNRILTDNTVCTHAAGHTIHGAGQLLVNTGGMQNAGTIVADETNSLTVDPNALNFTNTGTLRAASGGTLVLTAGTFINTAGLIEAQDMSTVAVSGATVMDGTMTTGGSGTISVGGGSTFTNVTNAGVVQEANNQSTVVTGTLTNNSTWSLNSVGNLTDLNCNGGATLGGSGSLVMSNNGNNRILMTDNSQCVNGAGHTIRGAGQLLVNTGGMLNKGAIIADQMTALTIDPNDVGFTNQSLLQAQDGGTLILSAGKFTNTNAVIKALNASLVQISSALVSQGQLVTTDTSTIEVRNGSTLDNLINNAAIQQPNNHLAVATHTLTNNGTWSLLSSGNLTDLYCNGTATFTGSGSISMSDNVNNRILTDDTVCTNDLLHTIHGAGQLLANTGGMLNNGTIVADLPSGLTIDPNGRGFTNAASLRAANGATLTLVAGTFDNSAGVIEAMDGSEVRIGNGATVSGGHLTSSATGVISLESGPLLVDVTNTAAISQPNNNNATVNGTIVNNRTWSLDSAGNLTDLYCNSGATLSGSGSIVMSDNVNNRILPNDNTVCVHAAGHTIRGAGQLLVNAGGMRNAGTIIADQPSGLTIDPNALNFTNTGTLRAASGGTLTLTAGTFINTNGLIEAQNMSTVAVSGATVMDGTMTTSGSGTISVGGGSTFTNVTSTGAVQEANNQSAVVTGTLTNNSTWSLNSVGNLTDLNCNGGATLGGSGSLVMSNNGNNRILIADNTVCHHAMGHTIRGAGQLLANTGGMQNAGTIIADQPTSLTIDPNGNGFTNQGTLHAMGSGGITINPDAFTTSGSVVVDTGSSLTRSGTYTQTGGKTTVNGTLNATGLVDIQGGILEGTGTVAANVSNAGQVNPGTSPGLLTINGTYTQTSGGAFNVEIGGPTVGTDYDRLAVSGAATLTGGTINISLVNNFRPTLGSTFTVMTFASRTGDFTTYNGLTQSNGVVFSKMLTPTSLVLTVVSEAFTPTPTATGMLTPTPTSTVTLTAAPTTTATPTRTLVVTATPTPTLTSAPTSSPSATPTQTRTGTATPSASVAPTGTPTPTASSSPTTTSAATATVAHTPTPTGTPTSTQTALPTFSPTQTATPTVVPPTPTVTATGSSTPAMVVLVGRVLSPGRGGTPGNHDQVPVAGVAVDLFLCPLQQPCLGTGTPVASVVTDQAGGFQILIARDRLQGILPVVAARISPTLVFRAPVLAIPAAASSLARQIADTSQTVVDAISESAVRILDDHGFENFDLDGIAAVVQSVQTANADTSFADLTPEQGVNLAETTALADPAVQMALVDNQFTPTPTATPGVCVGDCSGDGEVTVDEVIKGVNIALGNAAVDTCPQFDVNGDGMVTINELIIGVNNVLSGCH